MIETNRDKLVMLAVQGEITPGLYFGGRPYMTSREGQPKLVPMVGGITYNVRVGDPALGWVGDHVEPGVSVWRPEQPEEGLALNLLSCIGNRAKVMTGQAKGAAGTVTGNHGLGRVIIDFTPDILERLAIGDKIQIRAFGTGLQLVHHPHVRAKAVSPDLLDCLGLEEDASGALVVPVAAMVPPEMYGSGLGFVSIGGDFDLQMPKGEALKRHGLDCLRLGDLVALQDCCTWSQTGYKEGAVSVGIVVHADCYLAGHGPGVTTILTADREHLKPVLAKEANIATYLKLRDSSL